MPKTATHAPKPASRERARAPQQNPNRARRKETAPMARPLGRTALGSLVEGVKWSIRNPKKSVPAVLVSAVLVYGLAPASHEAPQEDTCTDATHLLVKSHDGLFSSALSLDDIATEQSAKRHYLMTAQGLREANAGQAILRRDDKGALTDDLTDGLHCVAMPAPVVGGFAVTAAHETVGEIADANAITPAQFLRFNPQFAGKHAADILPHDVEVKVADGYDTSFVLVASAPGDIHDMTGTDKKERDAYLAANGAALSTGGTVAKGHEAYVRVPERAAAYVTAFDKAGVYHGYVAEHTPASAHEGTLPEGFTQRYVASVQAEAAGWTNHPDAAKYMPGETNLDQNWCAYFVLYNLNQSGADLKKWEHVGDARYYLPRVSDMWHYMTDERDKNFSSYDFRALREGKVQPQAGDVIFFNQKESWEKFEASIQNHVGTIVDYDAATRTITAIEGNTGDDGAVATKTYSLDDPRIMGISRPLEQKGRVVTVDQRPDALPQPPQLDDEQQAIGREIIRIGRTRGLSDRDIVTALNVAMQESNMHNRLHGDRDSGGVFQQRPSVMQHDGVTPYWGTYEQVTDPTYAINRFYDDLVKVPKRDEEPMLEVALDVQDPSRAAYESPTHNFVRREPLAWAIFDELQGVHA